MKAASTVTMLVVCHTTLISLKSDHGKVVYGRTVPYFVNCESAVHISRKVSMIPFMGDALRAPSME